MPGNTEINCPCLHYERTVLAEAEQSAAEAAEFERDFSEDTWYAPGLGLVRLEQHIGSATSMTWLLEEFTPGQE